MTKKSISFILALVFVIATFAPTVMAEEGKFGYTEERGRIGYGALTPFTDGPVVVESHIEISTTSYEEVNGEMHAIAMVLVDGSGECMTSIVDLDDQKILHQFNTPYGGYAYKSFTTSDGRMVLSCAGGDYVEYNPTTKTIRHAGKYKSNSSKPIAGGVVYDEARDTMYSNDSNSGYVNATVLSTGENRIIARMADHFRRGCEIGQVGDYIYTSGLNIGGDGGCAYLWKIHKDTGEYEQIPNPDDEVYEKFDMTFDIGKYIVTQGYVLNGGTKMFALDTDTLEWIPFDNSKYAIYTSVIGRPAEAGQNDMDKIRMFKNKITSRLCLIDDKLNITDTGIEYGSHLRGSGPWIELKDPAMPGLNAVTAQYNGNIYVFNFETKTTKRIDVQIPGVSVEHRDSYLDNVNGIVWVGGYKAGGIAAVDIKTGEIRIGDGDQPEGIIVDPATGLVYHGDYSGAHIREKDPSKPKEFWGKYVTSEVRGEGSDYYFGKLGHDQDRPFDLDIVGRELYIASIPNRNNPTPGALSCIDLDTEEMTVWVGIVPGQSLLTVTHKDKYVYFGTTATNGGGQPVSEDPAYIVEFDTETKKITRQIPFKIPGVSGDISSVNALEVSPDGTKLYAWTDGVYAMYDINTLELLKYNKYDKVHVDTKVGDQRWFDWRIYFEPKTGYLIHGERAGGQVVDPDTLEIVLEKPEYGWFCGFDENYNAYFIQNGTEVFKAPLIVGEDKRYLISGLSFFKTGEDVMYKSGEATEFKTYENNGRVMVPIRTAATSMGGSVSWDAKTNKITVTDKNGNTLSFKAGDNVVNIGGEGLKVGVSLEVKNGVSYIPMQILCDFMNVEIVRSGDINFIADAGSNYKPSDEVIDYIINEVY